MNIEQANNIVLARISDDTLEADMKLAMEQGKPFVIICTRNIQKPIIDKILNTKLLRDDNTVKWNNNGTIQISEQFRVYLICDTPNIHYSPDFSMKVIFHHLLYTINPKYNNRIH